MNDKHSILDSILGAFVLIHPDGYKFVFGAALATLILFAVLPPLGWLGAIATAYCAYFFRDPERITPRRAGLVTSAADGTSCPGVTRCRYTSPAVLKYRWPA